VIVEADYRMKLLGVGKEESIPAVARLSQACGRRQSLEAGGPRLGPLVVRRDGTTTPC
jgi:hypothetical protein